MSPDPSESADPVGRGLTRRCALAGAGLIAALALGGGPLVSGASASNSSLAATLRHAAPRLRRSETRLARAFAVYRRDGAAAGVESAIAAQDTVLDRLRAGLARQSASDAAGRVARGRILRGLDLILTSNRALAGLVHTRADGGTVSEHQVDAVLRMAARGNRELAAGTRGLARSAP